MPGIIGSTGWDRISLDLGFLVDADHDRVLRGRKIQPDGRPPERLGITHWSARFMAAELGVALLLHQAASITAPGSRLGVDMVSADYLTNPAVAPYLELAAARGARWQFGTNDPGGFLAAHGWQADIYDMFAVARSLGRWPPPGVPDDVADRAAAVGRNWFISATRVP